NQSTTTSSSVRAIVTQFETALAQRDCDRVRDLEKQLVAPPGSYAGSVLLATLWCSQQENPLDLEVNERLQKEFEEIGKKQVPLFDAVFLEELRVDALRKSGKLNEARAASANAIGISAQRFMSLVSGHVLRSELSDLKSALNGRQIEILESVKSSLSEPMSQALALVKFDDLIAQLPESDLKNKLHLVRLKLFSAIEYSFASQLTSLEELRVRGENRKADELATTLKKQFPNQAHQDRISALVGPETMRAPELTSSQTQNVCISSPNALGSLTERGDLTADRAIQLARIALNEGKPGDAVQTLDGLSDTQKSDRTRNLRREASEAHIRDLRRKANELYQRGNVSSDSLTKIESFDQCRQILENILSLYPEANRYTRVKIKKFLDSVSENLTELRKAQVK
ncbi:MAG: hypothetical protein RJB13_1789, partial [Pseudomonadota bacterium]